MTVLELTEETKSRFVLCDAYLQGIQWKEGGRDLELCLQLGGGESARLVCHWAHRVKIDLASKENQGGWPLSWEAEFQSIGKTWEMKFDFASRGSIDLVCNEVHLHYDSAT